jgi:hypothetical protein
MPRPQKHVFICTQARPPGHPRSSCADHGCAGLYEEFLWQLQQRDLFAMVAVTATEGIRYAKVGKDDVDEIVEQHLVQDRPVERLLMSEEFWGRTT